MLRMLVLRLIHYVIALGEFAFGVLKYIPQYELLFAKKHLASKVEADAKKLRKLPLHVGFLVIENEMSYKDLANLIVWSVTMGISYVSVYDMNGEIKRNSGNLQKEVERSKENMVYNDSVSHEIQIFTHSPQYTEKMAVGRGMKKASVHLLSAEDGCHSLVQVARNLSRKVAAQQSLVSDITPASVTALIHDSHQFPDPDLLLTFGPTLSLLGYLPWQIRLTEIIHVASHKGLSYEGFISSLHSYANTLQRFGK
ncbi:dehydrodolichyl diphosphate synthase complex subunit nus1-like [Littorina saxatilis]|uniref:ditrans,polycis-polyprenyl diphosphate synthase [(2E,6E)-farnesyldiphosphate specific] n=1 Tax=Littorina saxatilis TaxID=31220 RepID=A0AAN9GI58_9CAEN